MQEVQVLIDRARLPEADEIRYGVDTVHRLAKHLHLTTREVEAALRADLGAVERAADLGLVVRLSGHAP